MASGVDLSMNGGVEVETHVAADRNRLTSPIIRTDDLDAFRRQRSDLQLAGEPQKTTNRLPPELLAQVTDLRKPS